MANFIEHLGLDFLVETEDQVRGLWGYIAQEGKAITGYYGYPYLNQHFGDAQLILRTIRNDEEKRIEVVGMDTHSSGKDFAFFHPFDEPHDDEYDADLLKALIVVQQLGKLYEPKCMK